MTDNIEITQEGDLLTIQVDLSQSYGNSKTGKTITIASTKGNIELPDMPGVFLGMNIYRR